MISIFIIIALFVLLIASYTDIKTLEVPDWLSYALIATGVAGNLIYTVVYWDYIFILRSILGLGLTLLIGFGMFYTGQWGGGDSKILFGLGALLGLNFPFELDFLVKFLINMLFAGALYGLIWVIIMGIKNKDNIGKKIKKYLKKYSRIRILAGVATIVGLIVIFIMPLDTQIRIIFSVLLVLLYFMNYALILVKAIEEVAMIKLIQPEKLTEGDWIVDEIKVDGKYIAGPKDLGIEKKQIKVLLELKKKGKIKEVKVKYGIPFIPSFLMAIIYTIIYDNVILLMII